MVMSKKPNLEDLNSTMREQIAEAYRRGYFDGAAEARDRIVKAALADDAPVSAAVKVVETAEAPGLAPLAEPSFARVERGAVRIAVQHTLRKHQGLTAAEITKLVTEFDPRITASGSVSNELTRHEGTLYERRDTKWFAIAKNEEGPSKNLGEPSYSNGAAVRAA